MPITEIAERVGVSRPTVRKYRDASDFTIAAPVSHRLAAGSKLAELTDWIDETLTRDKLTWPKQRHTAQHLFDRLVAEKGYTGGYSIVQRYVKAWRQQDRLAHQGGGFNDLVWDPGFLQADFGEADFDRRDGTRQRKSFLQVVFPFSNQGFTQVFSGETAECVCQGLKDIFEAIGGVAPVVVFDNATGVGKRIMEVVHETELFARFRLHYRFQVRFCNPYSGHEKGCVEKKVGTVRKQAFVPVPVLDDITVFNQGLLRVPLDTNPHYLKQTPIDLLFAQDQACLLPLPVKPFDVVRYQRYTCDKYGKITVDGVHRYSVAPEAAGVKVIAGFRAHTVEILDHLDAHVLAVHERGFGQTGSSHVDQVAMMTALLRKPGAWQQSELRHAIPDGDTKAFLDQLDKPVLVDYLTVIHQQAQHVGIETVIQALDYLAGGHHGFTTADLVTVTARVDGFGLDTPPDPGPDLSLLDDLLGTTRVGE